MDKELKGMAATDIHDGPETSSSYRGYDLVVTAKQEGVKSETPGDQVFMSANQIQFPIIEPTTALLTRLLRCRIWWSGRGAYPLTG
jgi:hypothetical protein